MIKENVEKNENNKIKKEKIVEEKKSEKNKTDNNKNFSYLLFKQLMKYYNFQRRIDDFLEKGSFNNTDNNLTVSLKGSISSVNSEENSIIPNHFIHNHFCLIDRSWINKWKEYIGYSEIIHSVKKNTIRQKDFDIINQIIKANSKGKLFSNLDMSKIYPNNTLDYFSNFDIILKKIFKEFIIFIPSKIRDNLLIDKCYPLMISKYKYIIKLDNNTYQIVFREKHVINNYVELLIIFQMLYEVNQGKSSDKSKIIKEFQTEDINDWLKKYDFDISSDIQKEIKQTNFEFIIINKTKVLKAEKKRKNFYNSVNPSDPQNFKDSMLTKNHKQLIENQKRENFNNYLELVKNRTQIENNNNIITKNIEKKSIDNNKVTPQNDFENNPNNINNENTHLKNIDNNTMIGISNVLDNNYNNKSGNENNKLNEETKVVLNNINLNNNVQNSSTSNSKTKIILNGNNMMNREMYVNINNNNLINNNNNHNINNLNNNNNIQNNNQNIINNKNGFNNNIQLFGNNQNFNNNMNNNQIQNNMNNMINFNINGNNTNFINNINNIQIMSNNNNNNNNFNGNNNGMNFQQNNNNFNGFNNNINNFNNNNICNNNINNFNNNNNFIYNNNFNNISNNNNYLINNNNILNPNNNFGNNNNQLIPSIPQNNFNRFIANNNNIMNQIQFPLQNLNNNMPFILMNNNMPNNNMNINNQALGFNNNQNNSNNNIIQKQNSVIQINYPHLIGLQNIGQTCYMNSTLQCLSNISELSDFLINNFYSFDSNSQPLSTAYTNLLFKLLFNNENKKYIDPTDFKSIIGDLNPLFQGMQAADSKDLLFFIIERLHNELNISSNNNSNSMPDYNLLEQEERNEEKMLANFKQDFSCSNNSIISNNFYGIMRSIMICKECNIKKYSFQTFNMQIFILKKLKEDKIADLGVYYDNKLNLMDAFFYAEKEELLEGENMIYCNNCHKLTIGTNKQDFYSLPRILIIVLNRGKNNADFNEQFDIPEKIDFTGQNIILDKTSNMKYHLISVIKHLGESGSSGHFIAYVREGKSDIFYCYNDAIVSKVKVEDALKQNISMRDNEKITPYILFYHCSE